MDGKRVNFLNYPIKDNEMYPITLLGKNYCIGKTSLKDIAIKYKTPSYVYDLDVIEDKFNSLKKFISWPKLRICYAMKANSNTDILKKLKSIGSAIDAVSYGDVLVAIKAGFKPESIIFTTNNATDAEIDLVYGSKVLINIGDLSHLEKFGKSHPQSRMCLRVNTEVESGENNLVKTAGKESQFGILLDDIAAAKNIADKYHLKVIGIHEHTGSGVYDTADMFTSIERTLDVARQFPDLEFVDFGGGFKVPYRPDEERIDYEGFGNKLIKIYGKFCKDYGRNLELFIEPGKYLVAESGILLVEVNTLRNSGFKNKNAKIFAGVNSGFPQLIRPVLYGAYHHIINCSNPEGQKKKYTVAGDICEGGDIFAKDRMIEDIREGDILTILNAGAYGYSMASTYNNRPLPAEIIIEDGKPRISRERLSFEEYVKKYYKA
jgi:diaminopimelate decarboxylase